MLVERIAKSANVEKEEIEKKIEAKKAKLSGLISKEGAAQIIAAELGVNFDDAILTISELMPGMKKVNVIGKVLNLFPVREFKKKDRVGKVANLIIADASGSTKCVLWDTNHIALIETGEIKEGDVVEIKSASTRDNEIHLSSFSEIKKSDVVIENVKTERNFDEKSVGELQPGQNVSVRGTVVQLFNPRFFNVCPECGKKAEQDAEGYKCQEHGKVSPKERSLINFVLDDGSETIRVVLFSDQINKITNEEELKDAGKLSIFREDFLGDEIFLKGVVRKNQLFNNLEITGQDVEKIDVEKLIEVLEKN